MKLLALFIVSICLSAQVTVRPVDLPRVIDIGPQLVPATATTATSTTVWVTQITLTNKTGSDVTCNILDRQSTPRELTPTNVTITATSMWIMAFPEGRMMPSGITWSCSSGTAIVGHVVGKQQ